MSVWHTHTHTHTHTDGGPTGEHADVFKELRRARTLGRGGAEGNGQAAAQRPARATSPAKEGKASEGKASKSRGSSSDGTDSQRSLSGFYLVRQY